jgi:AcrR family transcriptional regulator
MSRGILQKMEKNFSKREMNKARHRAAILDAAEKLFLQKGFDGASIDDVAKASGLTKRTLYQYFLSKEDLFCAVALKGGKKLTYAYEEAFRQGRDALDKIRRGNQAYLQFYQEYFGMFRILNYQPANQQNCAASTNFREIELLNANRMRLFAQLVEESRADGSVNPKLDTRKAVFFAFFAAFSLLYTISSTDRNVMNILGLDENDFLRFSFDLLADALK